LARNASAGPLWRCPFMGGLEVIGASSKRAIDVFL
jgi:hypothetical protein